MAVLALAAVVGSLYYVGRGAQSNGESRSRLPGSEQKQAANGPQQRADQPAAEEGPQGVPRETLRAEEATSPRPPPQPETLTVQVSVEGDPSLSILATVSSPTSRSPSQVSPRPSRRSARSA